MRPDRSFRVTIAVRGGAISGVIVDEDGREQVFEGWLSLIAAVQANEWPEDSTSTRELA
jgi:hypothetical protein